MNKGGFSWLKLLGITKYKRHIAKIVKIPFTKQGRKAKFSFWRW